MARSPVGSSRVGRSIAHHRLGYNSAWVPHERVLTNEEGIAEDLLSVLHGLVPQTTAYVHASADHVRAHVLSALVGPSVSVPVRDGRLGLGQFQRIVLVEFEGPRQRTIEVDSTRSWHT